MTPRSGNGVLYAFIAYALWGIVPLFWQLLDSSSAIELVAGRIVWSFILSAGLFAFTVRRGWWARLGNPRTLGLLTVAAITISINWGLYIWAANHDHVVEAALGYYINPILSILVGVFFLGERLALVQWLAVALAAGAVVVLTIDYGHLPWVALALAGSFAAYGLLKKQVNAGAVETLTIESAIVTPPALAYLIFLQATGSLTFGHLGWGYSLLIVSSGVVTVIPLLLFAAAATRLPLSTMGLIQYVSPTLQFLLGVFYFHESMSAGRWVGFGLVWLALMVLSGHGLLRAGARARVSSVSEPV